MPERGEGSGAEPGNREVGLTSAVALFLRVPRLPPWPGLGGGKGVEGKRAQG